MNEKKGERSRWLIALVLDHKYGMLSDIPEKKEPTKVPACLLKHTDTSLLNVPLKNSTLITHKTSFTLSLIDRTVTSEILSYSLYKD